MFRSRLVLFILLEFLGGTILAQSETHRMSAPITDYSVYTLEHSNGYTLMGGYFYEAGDYSGSVVAVNAEGEEDLSWPVISGDVTVIIPDGNGGYYAGGAIYSVDNEDVGNLIHILPNKTLDRSWLPNPFGAIYALTIKENTLYAGGTFVNIAGQTRYYAAAFDLVTGALTNWDPHPNNRVTEIEVTDDAVYLAGLFTTMNNGVANRNKIAGVDKNTGNVLPGWDLVLDGTSWSVQSLAASSDKLYIGGNFNKANGLDRNGLVSVSLSNATVDATWNPAPTASGTPVIYDLALEGTTLYAAGYFNGGIGGDNSMRHLGTVSATGTGAAIGTFKPQFDVADQVYSISLTSNAVLAYGTFNSINGETRITLGAISKANGLTEAWAPAIRGAVRSFAASGNVIFMAGNISGINWGVYNGIAIVEESTGKFWPHAINLPPGEEIETMVVNGTTMYVGGDFNSINGTARKNLAAIDLLTGAVTSWNPGASGTTNTSFDDTRVTSLSFKDNTLYVGGIFLNAGGQSRRGLAAIDATTGLATSWNPGVGDGTSMDEYILSMDIHENSLFVSGTFVNLAGETRPHLGAIDLTTGVLVNWHPNVLNEVTKVAVQGNAAYILGNFPDGVGGAIRPFGIAAIDIVTGEATAFNPVFNATGLGDFALTPTDIYVGGYFSVADGEQRPGLASYSLATGTLNSWNPDLGSAGEGNYDVEALSVSEARLYVGGGFIFVGNENRSSYTEYDLVECSTTAAIALDGSTLYASSGETYQWYHNDVAVDGATQQSFEINIFEYGRYAVEVTSNGCTARSEDYVYLVTEREEETGANISFYPNPVTDHLFVETRSDAIITVTDLSGRTQSSFGLPSGEKHAIDTNGWNPGAYIVRITTARSNQSFKIVKIK
jgi:hypothetical protein